jgi:hypothetical protein
MRRWEISPVSSSSPTVISTFSQLCPVRFLQPGLNVPEGQDDGSRGIYPLDMKQEKNHHVAARRDAIFALSGA